MRCAGLNRHGARCGNDAQPGESFCKWHQPVPTEASGGPWDGLSITSPESTLYLTYNPRDLESHWTAWGAAAEVGAQARGLYLRTPDSWTWCRLPCVDVPR